jgi:hypothetical protein
MPTPIETAPMQANSFRENENTIKLDINRRIKSAKSYGLNMRKKEF